MFKSYYISACGGACEKVFINKFRKSSRITFLEDSEVSLKVLEGSRKRWLIEGEKIYSFTIKVYIFNLAHIYEQVISEIRSRFYEIDDMLFDYRILFTKKNFIFIGIYCVNGRNLILTDGIGLKKVKFKSIEPIQVIYNNFFKRKIKSKCYAFIFKINSYMYFLNIKNNFILNNEVVNLEYDFNKDNFKLLFKNYYDEYKDQDIYVMENGFLKGPYDYMEMINKDEICIFS